MNNFDYEGAKADGYTDDEINAFLLKSTDKKPNYQKSNDDDPWYSPITKNAKNFWNNLGAPTGEQPQKENSELDKIDRHLLKNVPFDVEKAINDGYSVDEINDYLHENQPKRSVLEKAGRLGAQFGLGALQATAPGMAYELAAAPLAYETTQNMAYREDVANDLEQLQLQKMAGHWSDKDQELEDHLTKQLLDPSESGKFVEPSNVGIRDIAEKISGVDLHPEGWLEKSANFLGFIKSPGKYWKGATDLVKSGISPATITKAILPTSEGVRAASAGTLWQMAEEGNFGPMGTMGAMIAGDLIGHGAAGIYRAAKQPKKSAAQLFNFVTSSNSRKLASRQLIDDFNKSGLQLDAGSLTQSPLVQMMQARLAQSGLVGDALDNARKELSGQITREYQNIIQDLGEVTFENNYQASEAIKDALKVNEVNLGLPKTQQEGRSLAGRVATEQRPEYQAELLDRIAPQEFTSDAQAGQNIKTAANDIKTPIKEQFNRRWSALNDEVSMLEGGPQPELVQNLKQFVDEHSGSLLLGESTAEARVLRSAENLLARLSTEEGGLIGVSVNDLIKTKRTLADIANWEFGGSNYESAYKKLVGDLDNAINKAIQESNPQLLEEFQQLNAEYGQFKEAFENKNLKSLFEPKNENYNAIHNEFTTNPDKLRALEDIMYDNPRGQELVAQAKRDYAQKIIDNPNLSDRQSRNLLASLGPEYANDIERYMGSRRFNEENPLPRPATRQPLGIEAQRPDIAGEETRALTPQRVSETGKVSRANEGARKKMHEFLSKKNPDQIMKQMDTVQGIKKLKAVLETTPEGKELFKELSRYKIAEMIDEKLKDNITEQVKLNKFSKLLDTKKNQGIVKELLGDDSYKRLLLLQKNSGRLADSAAKFFNASKSGTSLIDMGLLGSAFTGLFMGNPWTALPAMAKIGGSRVMANLLADPVFLKELQKAIMTDNPKLFAQIIEKMIPITQKAMLESQED